MTKFSIARTLALGLAHYSYAPRAFAWPPLFGDTAAVAGQ